MNANERFELMAEKFYKETGYFAPGKDCPAGFRKGAEQEAAGAWGVWADNFYSKLFDLNFKVDDQY